MHPERVGRPFLLLTAANEAYGSATDLVPFSLPTVPTCPNSAPPSSGALYFCAATPPPPPTHATPHAHSPQCSSKVACLSAAHDEQLRTRHHDGVAAAAARRGRRDVCRGRQRPSRARPLLLLPQAVKPNHAGMRAADVMLGEAAAQRGPLRRGR
eukprot:353478-Chlamydomonas_euryale.AAC.7